MRRTRRLACAALLLLALAAPAAAQEKAGERLASLIEGRVTFALPPAWSVESHINTKSSGRAQVSIPNPATDKSPLRSNAILTATVVPQGVNVRHLSDGVYKNVYEGLAVDGDTFDGDDWRTMIWTVKDVVPYVVLHRFGLVNRVSVELMVVFPVEGNDPKWVEKTLAEFNALAASLKIDGQNRFASGVRSDKLPQPAKKVSPNP